MPKTLEGDLSAQGLKFGLIVSRFNSFITKRLLDGAMDALARQGVEEKDITVVWCPGSFEIPLVARRLVKSGDFDAVICLGAVIRGATAHFDYVASEVAKGIAQVSLETDTPVVFGVVTTDSIEQAIERAGTKHGNKGADAANTALEMIDLFKQV